MKLDGLRMFQWGSQRVVKCRCLVCSIACSCNYKQWFASFGARIAHGSEAFSDFSGRWGWDFFTIGTREEFDSLTVCQQLMAVNRKQLPWLMNEVLMSNCHGTSCAAEVADLQPPKFDDEIWMASCCQVNSMSRFAAEYLSISQLLPQKNEWRSPGRKLTLVFVGAPGC